MVPLLAPDSALTRLVWWGGAITSHWTGARSAGLSSARLGCLVSGLRATSIPSFCTSICFGVELNEFVPVKNSVSQTSDFGSRSVLGCYFSSGVLRRERLPATSQI